MQHRQNLSSEADSARSLAEIRLSEPSVSSAVVQINKSSDDKSILLSKQGISEGLQKFEFVPGTSINSNTRKLIRRHVMKSFIHQKRTQGILSLRTTAPIRLLTHRAAVSDATVDAHEEEDDDDQFYNPTRKYPE
jgi:hypothetical protein